MTQGSRPRNHLPEKVVMGVRGAAVRHIMTSDTAMLQTNRFMPVCRPGVLENWRKNFVICWVNIGILLWSVTQQTDPLHKFIMKPSF